MIRFLTVMMVSVFMATSVGYMPEAVACDAKCKAKARAEAKAEAKARARAKARAKQQAKERARERAKEKARQKAEYCREKGCFNIYLRPAFEHKRCTNCHGFNASPSIRRSIPAPAPYGNHNHPDLRDMLNGRSDLPDDDCATCHQSNISGVYGWEGHIPDASLNFKGKTPDQLCAMAKTAPSGKTVRQHLEQDPFIIWAIDRPRVLDMSDNSGYVTKPKAPPGNANEWRNRVRNWVNNGMFCGWGDYPDDY